MMGDHAADYGGASRMCGHVCYVPQLQGWDADCDQPATVVVLDADGDEWHLCAEHGEWTVPSD